MFSQLGSVLKNCDISVHLVEVSPKLSEIQALTLTEEKLPLERDADSLVYMKGVSKSGIPVSWYRDLKDVPKGMLHIDLRQSVAQDLSQPGWLVAFYCSLTLVLPSPSFNVNS